MCPVTVKPFQTGRRAPQEERALCSDTAKAQGAGGGVGQGRKVARLYWNEPKDFIRAQETEGRAGETSGFLVALLSSFYACLMLHIAIYESQTKQRPYRTCRKDSVRTQEELTCLNLQESRYMCVLSLFASACGQDFAWKCLVPIFAAATVDKMRERWPFTPVFSGSKFVRAHSRDQHRARRGNEKARWRQSGPDGELATEATHGASRDSATFVPGRGKSWSVLLRLQSTNMPNPARLAWNRKPLCTARAGLMWVLLFLEQ